MSGVTLDAGALIAADRGNSEVLSYLRAAADLDLTVTVPAPVVAQAWRSPRQVRIARLLAACVVEDTGERLARQAGQLLGSAGRSDAADAIVVASAARRGATETILTSDPDDLGALAAQVPRHSQPAISRV